MATSITLKRIEALREQTPKRRRFSDFPVVKSRADGQHLVSPPFGCIDRLFEAETGLSTNSGPYGYYLFLNDAQSVTASLKWQKDREHLVFLRDALSYSVAIDFNLASAGEYTTLGQAEHDAKANRTPAAVSTLASACAATIQLLGPYAGADLVCAVPPSPEKAWDLPTELATSVAAITGKELFSECSFNAAKQSVKALALEDKWKALENADLKVESSVTGRTVILIDDKYQSGTTIQYVASKLLDAGALGVYGLCPIKTWRDTDNK